MNPKPKFQNRLSGQFKNHLAGGAPALLLGLAVASGKAQFSDGDWAPLGSGMNGYVFALAVSGTNLYAGGYFTTAGGVPAKNIAKWSGGAWSALGVGIPVADVRALVVSGTNIYAGLSGGTRNLVSKWDGSNWYAVGSGIGADWDVNPAVYALAACGTNLYAGGRFSTAGGVTVNHIAKWDGNGWSALGSGMGNGSNPSDVLTLAVSGTNLYAGGYFATVGGVPATNIATWNGRAWSALGAGIPGALEIRALAVIGTDLYVGGQFGNAGGVTAQNIAKWDGTNWSALGSGMNGAVSALAVCGTDLYAGGTFTAAGGVPANYIAKWDGTNWSALGSGLNYTVIALAADELGHLFVGGCFTLAGTNASSYIARANLGSVPTILTPLQSQAAEVGSPVDFTPDIAGYLPMTCELFFNGACLMCCGADGCLTLTNADFSMSGTYTVVVTNIFGAVTSAPITLNVIPPVERRPVPAINLMALPGSSLGLDYCDALGSTADWETMATMTLSNNSQFYFDLTAPLPPQRFYRVWRSGTPGVIPSQNLNMIPAITLTGNIGDKLRLDCINQYGPTDAWVTLDTVTLTNTSQLYFDVSAPGQPQRLYRIVPVP